MAKDSPSLQTKPDGVRILKILTAMAERLGLSSNQVMILYAANNGWTNLEWTTVAFNRLQKIADDRKIELRDDEPFILQLIKWGVILPEEAVIFGWATEKKDVEKKNEPANPTRFPQSEPTATPPPERRREAFLKDLSPLERKAEPRHLHSPEEVVFMSRCVECHMPMWTWTEIEDICELCGYELRERIRAAHAKQQKGKARTNAGNAFQREAEAAHAPTGMKSGSRQFKNPMNPVEVTKGAAKSPFLDTGAAPVVKNPFSRS